MTETTALSERHTAAIDRMQGPRNRLRSLPYDAEPLCVSGFGWAGLERIVLGELAGEDESPLAAEPDVSRAAIFERCGDRQWRATAAPEMHGQLAPT